MKFASALMLLLILGTMGVDTAGLSVKSPGCDPAIHDCTTASRTVV
ncbi:MAG: hypothetical protein ACFB4J_03325 [Elainellaceae cyanobacterium]